ncbi:MAG: carboxypeptidase-like regulatory domain-containing protein, partial [Planctomycetota bacterium]|nr:carboxypeptidase-like regulatory domain-containing protein [Planctomycetota bacterium]
PDADGLPPREARTDAMGRVRFEQLVASLYDVQVTDEDGTRHTKSLPLKAGANESLELLLVATRPVEGIVRQGGPEGPGVAQAELHVVVRTAQDEHRVERTWSTDYAGAFRVDMPRGRIEALHIRAEGHAARWLRRYELPRAFLAAYASAAKEAARLELVLPPGGLLHGIVRAPDGKPVADLELLLRWSVMPLGDEDLDIARTRTATDGSYRFEHCPAAVVRLQVASSRFGTLGEPTIAMGAGQEVERNLVVRPATVLQGIVSGTHAPVVAGARVWINAGDGVLHTADGVALETFTDERGWWRISGVAPVPRYFVRASHGDLRSPALEVAPHRPAPPVISLRLAGAGSVRGRILETATDEPRAGVQVLLTRNDPRDGSAQVVHSDAEGRYEATGLVAGAWTLWCSVPGRVPVRLPVEVDLQEPTLVDVPLAEGEVFEGLVLDPEGAPIEGAQVHVTSRDPATSRFPTRPPEIAVTDASGRFRLGGYATGRYAVTAWIQRTTNRAQVVVDRGRRDLRLTLEKPQANR